LISVLKRVGAELCPPVLWRALKKLSGSKPSLAHWEKLSEAEAARAFSAQTPFRGWNKASVAAAEASRLAAFADAIKAPRAIAAVHESDHPEQLAYWAQGLSLAFAYVLSNVRQNSAQPRVLDWGGGLGHSYLMAKQWFPELAIDYTVKELPEMANLGRSLQPSIRFVTQETELSADYDLVMASGSIHYSADWRAALTTLVAQTRQWLYITRQPLLNDSPSYVFVQRVPHIGYDTEYPGWAINREDFLAELERLGMRVEREFLVDERAPIVNAEIAQYCGFLLSKAR
jgi:putative methyltransferase (TIGR04325 family)